MRSRLDDDRVTELTRRRLAALAAELAAARGERWTPDDSDQTGDTGETGDIALERALGPGSRGRPGAARPPQPSRSDQQSSVASPVAVPPGRHARRDPGWRARIAGWTVDRLPPPLTGRPHLGSAQAGLVLVIVAAGLVLAAWWLLRTGGSGTGVAAPPRPTVAPVASSSASSSSASSAPGAASTPGASAAGGPGSPTTGTDRIVVDVAGKVRHPGIAVLPAGSRVVDAVRAAGGVRPGVDRSTVNLARPLTDGEQVLIGVGPPGGVPDGVSTSPAASPGAGPGALVNINTADQAALETLPGVGPVTAQAILQWRTENGAFTSVDELLEVSGIGDATLAKIAPYVTL